VCPEVVGELEMQFGEIPHRECMERMHLRKENLIYDETLKTYRKDVDDNSQKLMKHQNKIKNAEGNKG
jgi:hypothetical protein